MISEHQIADRLQKIEERQEQIHGALDRIEKLLSESNEQINAIHKHVPFVDWLDERRRSLQSVFSVGNTLRNIGLTVAPVFSSDVVHTLTESSQESIENL